MRSLNICFIDFHVEDGILGAATVLTDFKLILRLFIFLSLVQLMHVNIYSCVHVVVAEGATPLLAILSSRHIF